MPCRRALPAAQAHRSSTMLIASYRRISLYEKTGKQKIGFSEIFLFLSSKVVMCCICDGSTYTCNDSKNFLSQSSALREGLRRDHRMKNACVSAGWVKRRQKVQNEQRKEFVRWTIFLIFSIIAPKVAQGIASNAVSLPAGTSEWLANDFPVSYLIKSSAVYKMPCENMCILHMYASYVWTCT